MASETLMQFFAGQKLTQLMQSESIKRGLPRSLPAELFAPSLSKPPTDEVEYIQYNGNRQGATIVARSSPSKARSMPGATRKYATALNFKDTLPIGIQMLDALKSDNPLIVNNARQALVRDYANFRSLFENARTNMVASTFANGKIWVDGSGNQLGSSSGAVQTIDMSIPTANQITKDGSGSTYNIGDWSSASTDLGAALRTLKDANLKANNYPLTTVLYGSSVPSYLAKNTVLKDYFARHQDVRQSIVIDNEIPDGTLGFKWRPVHSMYFNDTADSTSTWFGANFIGVMPDVEDSWYEFVEAGNLVPNGVATAQTTIDQMIEQCSVVNGMYSYAEMAINPLSLNVHMGDSALSLIKVPGTYYFGTCA